jgi:hypothetical protein
MKIMRKLGVLFLLWCGAAAAQPAPGDQGAPPLPQQPAQPPQPPPGSTRATFLSLSALQWDVTIGEAQACTTPCSLYVAPAQWVSLHSREDYPVRLDVGMMPGGDVVVQAKPLQQGKYAGGIVGTTFSGMALATGVTLAAVGYGTDNSGMRTAGLITGVAGGVGLYLSIELMKAALPKAEIGPARPYVAGNQVGLAGHF